MSRVLVFWSSLRWNYSFNSIMEVHVRRRTRMWSWANIKQHRKNLLAYKNTYKTKLLTQNKLSPDTEQQIQVTGPEPACSELILENPLGLF